MLRRGRKGGLDGARPSQNANLPKKTHYKKCLFPKQVIAAMSLLFQTINKKVENVRSISTFL